ncbi:MAG: NADH-quinone oxidoreductase subunit NuoB [Pelovirga sp.]
MAEEKKNLLRVHTQTEEARRRELDGHPPEELASIVQFAQVEKVLDFCRANSLWPMTFGLACCAIEMMSAGMARFDLARFGAEVFRPSPRQCDLMIVAGTVNKKMAPAVLTLYEQMAAPRYVIALGNCAISGGPFAVEENYNVIEGVDRLVPVDVYVPGCPPRPETLFEAIFKLQEKITGRRFPIPMNKMPEGA